MRSKSLMLQLSVAIVLISTVVLAMFGYFRYQHDSNTLSSDLEASLAMTAEKLSLGLRDPLYSFQENAIDGVVLSEMKNPIVKAIFVVEPWESEKKYWYVRDANDAVVMVDKILPEEGYLTAIRKITHEGEEVGEVRVYATPEYMQKRLQQTLISDIVQIILLDLLLVFLVISLLRLKVISPLIQLRMASSEIAKGNLEVRTEPSYNDEIGALAVSFNQMTIDLKKSRKDLEKYSKQLEKKVKERTEELNKKVEELEKFNKMAIGREHKMIELKEKIKELEGVK